MAEISRSLGILTSDVNLEENSVTCDRKGSALNYCHYKGFMHKFGTISQWECAYRKEGVRLQKKQNIRTLMNARMVACTCTLKCCIGHVIAIGCDSHSLDMMHCSDASSLILTTWIKGQHEIPNACFSLYFKVHLIILLLCISLRGIHSFTRQMTTTSDRRTNLVRESEKLWTCD